ncbi:BI1-like protein (Protein LIFEGUARD 5) (AtLFG5) [Durusdinium trenchii]|uniref:BI1-like protein (Protein LIFEGUARD 5) (AtLFG5) n=1 Tax=Durusdinium trenchii TaxID=1381693 RepID=A0ABP0R8Q1_9DINO
MVSTDIESPHFGNFNGISAAQIRLGFIRKVYGIVCAQVTATALFAALCCGPLQHPVTSFVMHWPSTFRWGSLIATGLSLFLCYTGKNSFPMNFYGLCLLTAVMACDVGVVSALASAAGLGALVAQAALITALLVAGLTIYTFRSKRDFSFLGAVIFCAYLVFDTWRIANELEVDDYVEGAVQLYMDIINLSCGKGSKPKKKHGRKDVRTSDHGHCEWRAFRICAKMPTGSRVQSHV